MPTSSYKIDFQDTKVINPGVLETFDFVTKELLIKIETNEFSAVCPFSGLPDIGNLKVLYYPDGGKCLELKSFKFYLLSFRSVGIYQEEATSRIYSDLSRILGTQRLKVILFYNTRGGIDTTCELGNI